MTYTRENPSPAYRELVDIYAQIHNQGLEEVTSDELFDGRSLYPHLIEIGEMIRDTGCRSVLDFGSGKGKFYKQSPLRLADGREVTSIADFWGVDEIVCYDPGVEEFSTYPARRFDAVICTDVLEHIPEPDIGWFLGDLFSLADKVVFANIASYRAIKTLPNGWNAHVTIKPHDWWRDRIGKAASNWNGEMYRFEILQDLRGIRQLICALTGTPRRKRYVVEDKRVL